MISNSSPTRVLCIGGHDPTGGAGIQADIESIAALGGRALTLVTALTEQDSRDVAAMDTVWPGDLLRLGRRLLADIEPEAAKIGLVGDAALCPAIANLVPDGIPLVLDPVLAAGGGARLGEPALARAILKQLVPRASLVTPNRREARALAGCEDVSKAAGILLEEGAGAVLVTGADEADGDTVTNRLYTAADEHAFNWEKLPHTYHGSGCTLASACAMLLGRGLDMLEAVQQAQAFTWDALKAGDRPGRGQHLPLRRARA